MNRAIEQYLRRCPAPTVEELYALWLVCNAGEGLSGWTVGEVRQLGEWAHGEAVRLERKESRA